MASYPAELTTDIPEHSFLDSGNHWEKQIEFISFTHSMFFLGQTFLDSGNIWVKQIEFISFTHSIFFLVRLLGRASPWSRCHHMGAGIKKYHFFICWLPYLSQNIFLFCSHTFSKVFDIRLAVALKKIFSASLKTGEEKIVRMAVSDFENVSRSIHFEYASLYKI